MRVEVQLDDTLRVVKTNRAFIDFIGAGPQQAASLKSFLVEPEAQAELLRGCGDGVASEELGASPARVIDVVFNTRAGDQGGAAGFLPRQVVCRATPCRSANASGGATLKLEILEVSRPHGGSSGASSSRAPEPELPRAGPRSLGRSLAARCSL